MYYLILISMSEHKCCGCVYAIFGVFKSLWEKVCASFKYVWINLNSLLIFLFVISSFTFTAQGFKNYTYSEGITRELCLVVCIGVCTFTLSMILSLSCMCGYCKSDKPLDGLKSDQLDSLLQNEESELLL